MCERVLRGVGSYRAAKPRIRRVIGFSVFEKGTSPVKALKPRLTKSGLASTERAV